MSNTNASTQTCEEGSYSWFLQCLSQRNDAAIEHHLRRVSPQRMQELQVLMQGIIETPEMRMGNRQYLSRFFAVPVTITTSEPVSAEELEVRNVRELIKSFQRHRLIEKGVGMVFLSSLFSSSYVDAFSPSQLYLQAQDMVKTISDAHRKFPCPRPLVSTNACGTYITTGYLIGVAFWHPRSKEPAFVSDCQHRHFFAKELADLLSFGLHDSVDGILDISVSRPAPLFSAFRQGAWDHASKAISIMHDYMSCGGTIPVHAYVDMMATANKGSQMAVSIQLETDDGANDPSIIQLPIDNRRGSLLPEVQAQVETALTMLDVEIRSRGHCVEFKSGAVALLQ